MRPLPDEYDRRRDRRALEKRLAGRCADLAASGQVRGALLIDELLDESDHPVAVIRPSRPQPTKA